MIYGRPHVLNPLRPRPRPVAVPGSRAFATGTLGVAVAVAALLVLAACGAEQEPNGKRYDVDGVVRGIDRSGETTRLTIEHEAIPDFVDIDGQVVGMDAMTMTMSVWSGASVPATLIVGDAVRFRLDVDWGRIPSALIVDLEVVEAPPAQL